MSTSTGDAGKPQIIAIVAMGPSRTEYLSDCVSQSSRWQVADHVMAINAMAGVIQHDSAVIMDRLSYFGPAARDGNAPLQGYSDWLPFHKGPIYTCEVIPEYPGSVQYPLKEVLQDLGFAYFNSTVAYALALAIHWKPKMIRLYGCDFLQNDTNDGRKGRACVEYWIATAIARGIKVYLPKSTTLCDSSTGRTLYGYGTQPDVEALLQKTE